MCKPKAFPTLKGEGEPEIQPIHRQENARRRKKLKNGIKRGVPNRNPINSPSPVNRSWQEMWRKKCHAHSRENGVRRWDEAEQVMDQQRKRYQFKTKSGLQGEDKKLAAEMNAAEDARNHSKRSREKKSSPSQANRPAVRLSGPKESRWG